jgi:hypothetical protein
LLAFLFVLLGFVAACATASLAMATYLVLPEGGNPLPNLVSAFLGILIFGLPMTLFFSLPGFLVLRLVLHLARRSDPFSFAFAGAVNAYGLAVLFHGGKNLDQFLTHPPDPMFAVAGALGGIVALLIERKLPNDVLLAKSKS